MEPAFGSPESFQSPSMLFSFTLTLYSIQFLLTDILHFLDKRPSVRYKD